MFALSYIISIFAVICFVFAGFLLLKRHRDSRAVYLALLTMCAGIWALGNAEADLAASGPAVIFWTLIASFGFVFFATFFLCFVLCFRRQGNLSLWATLAACLPSALFYIGVFNPFTITNTVYNPLVLGNAPSQVSFGLPYLAFALFIHILFATAIVLLFRYVRHAPASIRLQGTYILIGAGAALVGSAVFDVVLPLLGENRFYNIGPLSTGLMIACLSYAIIRHHLLDIRVIVQKGLIYTALFSIVIAAYLGILELVGLFLDSRTALAAPISAGLVMLIGIFTVPPIEHFFKAATDRIFFKDPYDYAEALRGLTEQLSAGIDIEDIAVICQGRLSQIFKAQVLIVPPDATPPYSAALTVPIVNGGGVLGTIFLGEKRSGDPYTSEDKKLLETFAYEAAIAFGRAMLFEQVKRHAAELEEKIEERTEQLRQTQEQQTRMMLDISHGLQTPLAVFQTKLEQLKPLLPKDQGINHFEASLADLSNFIYDLLKLARLESNREELRLERLCLTPLLNEIAEEIEIIASARDIKIRKDIAADVYVLADAKRIREVVMNLASNSIKYMRASGKKEITFTLVPEGEWAAFAVADTGIGISPRDMPNIFERFYRVQGSPGGANGSGLGLAISKYIIEQHGGTLIAESTLGSNTAMTIRLPLSLD